MSESPRATLAAMLDDETDELELRRLLKQAASDPELLRTWERYSMAQSLLHEPRLHRLPEDFSAKVALRLAGEDAPGRFGASSASSGKFTNRLASLTGPRRFAARAAIAATVAVALFIGLRAGIDRPAETPQIAEQPAPPAAAPVVQVVEVDSLPPTPVDPEARQRLLEYIESMRFDPAEPPEVEHIEDSPLFRLVNEVQD